jgi:SpoVK/Ycf46/Vps4 family AAA+-type ATPase
MIGMRELKRTIVHLIVYYLQDFESSNSNMLHTVIEGPPGTGKTEVAKIIGEIYLGLGILQNKTFRIVRRSDLIGGYLGQTAIKTQKVIDEARGGVLFIDEAYSLGNPEGRDSYSKECIDTLNQNLTENKANFICIIAGYPNSLKESFFSVNHGLERRFPFRFMIEEYMPEELREIFLKIVEDNLWTIFENNIIHNIPISFFETNKQYFIFNGGDMENLFQLVKISHSQRIYSLDSSVKKKITLTDLTNAFTLYLNNKNIKNRSEIHSVPPMMYL